jgi:hypothetical protein
MLHRTPNFNYLTRPKQRKTGMRFGTLNVRSLCRSPITVAARSKAWTIFARSIAGIVSRKRYSQSRTKQILQGSDGGLLDVALLALKALFIVPLFDKSSSRTFRLLDLLLSSGKVCLLKYICFRSVYPVWFLLWTCARFWTKWIVWCI